RLPEATREVMAEAAVLGRSFSLRDVRDVRAHLGEPVPELGDLAALFAPGAAIGLLAQHPDGSAADYSFTHEGVREYAAGTRPPPSRGVSASAPQSWATRRPSSRRASSLGKT